MRVVFTDGNRAVKISATDRTILQKARLLFLELIICEEQEQRPESEDPDAAVEYKQVVETIRQFLWGDTTNTQVVHEAKQDRAKTEIKTRDETQKETQ